MKSLLVIYNKDEKAIARNCLRDLDELITLGDIDSGYAEICKPGQISLLILDERLNDFSLPGSRSNLKIADLIARATLDAENKPPIIAVILDQDDEKTKQIEYSDLGVDAFLKRPLGTKDFQTRIKEVSDWSQNPPGIIKIRNSIRVRMAKGEYENVVPILRKIHESPQKELAFSILLARCLLKWKQIHLDEATHFIQALTAEYPDCSPVQKLLIEVHETRGFMSEALDAAVNVFKMQQSALSLNKCVDLATRMSDETESIEPFARVFEVFDPDLARVNKAGRQKMLNAMMTRIKDRKDIAHLAFSVERSGDLLAASIQELGQLFKRLELLRHPQDSKEIRSASLVIAQEMLNVVPGCTSCIEAFVDALIEKSEFRKALKYLSAVEAAKKNSPESYKARIRLAFAEGHLKEASDNIAFGRRLKQWDDDWDVMAKQWKELYAKTQK